MDDYILFIGFHYLKRLDIKKKEMFFYLTVQLTSEARLAVFVQWLPQKHKGGGQRTPLCDHSVSQVGVGHLVKCALSIFVST